MIKGYDEGNVISGLNWEINQGDVVALLGRNGSGKTTLLECIMNIRQYESGELKLWGHDWENLSQQKRQKIAFVAQEIIGFEWMKVEDFINYLGGFFPDYDKSYALKLVNDWGLVASKKVGDLSKGQKQILHVIQALSIKPELLILDEPVAHLDPSMRRKFIAELIDLAYENKMTVIFSSHIISDIERVASKVALLKNKKIALEYDIENLKSHISHVKISADEPLIKPAYFSELDRWKTYAHGATAKIIKPLSKNLDDFIKESPNKIECTPMSLEDWYLEVNNESA